MHSIQHQTASQQCPIKAGKVHQPSSGSQADMKVSGCRGADLFEDKQHQLAENSAAGYLHGLVHHVFCVPVMARQSVRLQQHSFLA